MPPDFLSSHDLGTLAKKLQQKRKTHFNHEKYKIKIAKIKKTILTRAFHLLTHKCVKKSINPLTVSYVAHGGQQTTIAPTYKPVNDS